MRKSYILSILALLCWIVTFSQVNTNFNNTQTVDARGKFHQSYIAPVDLELPARDITSMQETQRRIEQQSVEVKPFRFAEPIPLRIDIPSSIRWNNDGEFAYGKYTIKAKGALNTSVNFENFNLPAKTEMYVYNENAEMITGPVTEAENNKNQSWGSWAYKGEYITIEIKTPITTLSELTMTITNLAYGFRPIYKVGNFGQSGACNINVLCALGTNWGEERNSVALVLDGNGSSFCSGSMLMNACSTPTPYFLTANHCFTGTGSNVTNWRFTFQAWSATCTPSQNSNGVTFNGSTLRANWAESDFCLVELATTPASNSNIRYAGWNRGSTAATSAMAIHHPRGDVMKISEAAAGTVRATYGGISTNHHWRADWTQGVTEPGSSGSPLFDQDHRVVGQLHGGPSACGAANLWDFYGSFDLSWTGGGTNATRLSNWLDPTGTGAVTTNTTNRSMLGTLNATLSAADIVCTSEVFTLSGVPAGATITWTTSGQPGPLAILSCTSNCTSTTVTANGDGTEWITATINFCGQQQVITKQTRIGAYQSFSVSGPYQVCRNQTVSFSVTGYVGLTVTGWTPPSGWTVLTSGSNYIVMRAPNTSSPPTYNLTAHATSCGTPVNGYKFIAMNNCQARIAGDPVPEDDPKGIYRVSPNPASSMIRIEPVSTVKNPGFTRIQIVNKMGRPVMQQLFPAGTQRATMNVNRLSPDVYVVRIFNGTKTEEHKIVVQ